MKHWLVGALICFCSPANAAYFHVLTPLDELKSGVFVAVGTPNDNVSYGAVTTIIKHRAEDGALLIPGVSWNLLDVGAAKSDHGEISAVVGPSIDLSEPIKALALKGLEASGIPGLGAVKALLAPAVDGKSCVAASLGPGWALNLRSGRGSLVVHAGLAAKWGGPTAAK